MKGVQLKWIHSLDFDFLHFDHCCFLAMGYMDHIHIYPKDVVSSTHIPGGVLLQAAAAWDGSVTCNMLRRLCGCNGGDWISYTLGFFFELGAYPRFFLKKLFLPSCSFFPFCLNSHDLQKTHVTFVDLEEIPVLSSGVFCRCCWQFAPQLIKSQSSQTFFLWLWCVIDCGVPQNDALLTGSSILLIWFLLLLWLGGFVKIFFQDSPRPEFSLRDLDQLPMTEPPLAWPALLRTYGRHASQLSTSDSFEVASITKMVTATVGLHNFVCGKIFKAYCSF